MFLGGFPDWGGEVDRRLVYVYLEQYMVMLDEGMNEVFWCICLSQTMSAAVFMFMLYDVACHNCVVIIGSVDMFIMEQFGL